MKFNLNKQDKLELEELIEAKNINIAIADMLLECSRYECITDPSILRDSGNLKETYLEELYDFLELDMENDENIELADSYIKPSLDILNINDYISNPYNKNIRANKNQNGNYSLNVEHYAPYQLFPSDEIEVLEDDYYHEISKVGLFEKKFNFLSLLDKDTIWMCITPNEINTMKHAIQEAHGNVVTFGLGLGYFAYMVSEKENVNHVTIIEKDRKVIDLFMFYIYPQFKNKEKIQIVYVDAFDYLKLDDMQAFDYAFVDLWHNPEDGLPLYMKFKKEESRFKYKFDYWFFYKIF